MTKNKAQSNNSTILMPHYPPTSSATHLNPSIQESFLTAGLTSVPKVFIALSQADYFLNTDFNGMTAFNQGNEHTGLARAKRV